MTSKTVNEEPREWLIRKSGYYYRPDRAGYTSSVYEAGRYTESEAKAEASIEPGYITAIHQATQVEITLELRDWSDAAYPRESSLWRGSHLGYRAAREIEQLRGQLDSARADYALLQEDRNRWRDVECERLRGLMREAIFGHKMWEGIYGSSPESRKHLQLLESGLGDAPASPVETFGEPAPQYSCFVEGCPGNHPGKYGVCPTPASHDDLTQFKGALVRIVLEGEGCGSGCSKEFHREAIDSMLGIARRALAREQAPEKSFGEWQDWGGTEAPDLLPEERDALGKPGEPNG